MDKQAYGKNDHQIHMQINIWMHCRMANICTNRLTDKTVKYKNVQKFQQLNGQIDRQKDKKKIDLKTYAYTDT